MVKQVELDTLERRYFLNLIEKYHRGKSVESEFGYPYSITDIDNKEKCKIISSDGIFELGSRIINIEVGEINE